MSSIRGTWKNVERKEHLHHNRDETLLHPGSASLAVWLRMLESEERAWGSRNSGTKDQEKGTTVVWTRGTDGWEKTTKCSFTWTCRGKEKQRETEEDMDGQCQGRPEREKHRLDQDW